MTFILGITGGIGSGKSTATDFFSTLDIDIVDADIVSREVVTPGSFALTAIKKQFGNDILLASGELNRAKLRQHIFSDPKAKEWLEALLHPLIREKIKNQLEKVSSPYGILSSPLLFETQQYLHTHRTLVIDCSQVQQLKRTLSRDNTNEEQIKNIMSSQLSREQRNARADDVINNDDNVEQLQQSLYKYHLALLASLNNPTQQNNR